MVSGKGSKINMGINTINPQIPRIEGDRRSLALESLRDEGLIGAVIVGVRQYTRLLKATKQTEADTGIQVDPEGTIKDLQLLEEIAKTSAIAKLPKVSEQMDINRRGAAVARVNLGYRPPRDGTTSRQIEFRVESQNSQSLNEEDIAASYRGVSPERIVHDSTPMKVSLALKHVAYFEEQDKYRIVKNAGIVFDVDTSTGQITKLCGLTFLHGVPHFSEDLLTEEDAPQLQLSQETVDRLTLFAS